MGSRGVLGLGVAMSLVAGACQREVHGALDDDIAADDDSVEATDDDVVTDDDSVFSDDDTADDDAADDDTPASPYVGRDYLRDLANADVLQPPGMASMVSAFQDEMFVVMQPVAIHPVAGTIEMIAAPVEKEDSFYEQDLCVPTWSLEGTWTGSSFQVGPTHVAYRRDGIEVTVYDYEATGLFAPTGDAMLDGTTHSLIDTRGLDELVDPGAGAGAVCSLLTAMGITCQSCPYGQGPYCLEFIVGIIPAFEVDVRGTHPQTGQIFTSLTEVTDTDLWVWQNAGHCD